MAKVLHLDMDSYFASVEQQARPSLRGQPVGIALADSPGATIIAASREAKPRGVGTGTRVGDAKSLIPDIVILSPDAAKYRVVHDRFRAILEEYPADVRSRSIDEVAMWWDEEIPDDTALAMGADIKRRIKEEVGDWLSVSVGWGTNWFLAKTACNYQKPDGLFIITDDNVRTVLADHRLQDLCGIAQRMEARMNLAGISTPVDLYELSPWELKRRFGIIGYYWHLRLHGHSIDTEDWPVRSIGHSSVIPKVTMSKQRLKPLLQKLCERAGRRMRKHGWVAHSVSVGGRYDRRGGWYTHRRTAPFDDSGTLFRHAWRLFGDTRLVEPVRMIAVRMSDLAPSVPEQLSLLDGDRRKSRAVDSVDAINDKWGEQTVHPAGMLGLGDIAKDSVAFGREKVVGGWTGT